MAQAKMILYILRFLTGDSCINIPHQRVLVIEGMEQLYLASCIVQSWTLELKPTLNLTSA